MSSSSISSFSNSSPHPNSSLNLNASTTETTLSSLHILGNPYCSVDSCNTVIVCAIGIGSQIPLASISM